MSSEVRDPTTSVPKQSKYRSLGFWDMVPLIFRSTAVDRHAVEVLLQSCTLVRRLTSTTACCGCIKYLKNPPKILAPNCCCICPLLSHR